MSLERLSVELRERRAQQANDLGVALVRSFGREVFRPWLMVMLPLIGAAAALATVEPGLVWISLLALWWIRPLVEVIPLIVMSRGLFGRRLGARETLGRMLRSWWSWRMLAEVTVVRVFPFRAFTIPVWHLEQLRGKEARRRASRLVEEDTQGVLLTLLFVFSGFFVAFAVAGLVGLGMMIPESIDVDLGMQVEQLFEGTHDPWFGALVVAIYGLVVAVLHPFYVGCCFANYLRWRVKHEGWDIELAFRRIAAGMIALLVFVTFSVGPLAIGGVTAQERPLPLETTAQQEPGEVIDEILAADEFGRTVTETRWVPKEDEEREPVERRSDDSGGIGFGTIFEGLLWLLSAGAVVAALAYVVRRVRPARVDESEPEPALAHTESKPEPDLLALPPRLLDEAETAWGRGESIVALSLLYRGLIEELTDHFDLVIGEDATAREVARIVSDAGGPADYVRRLGRAWTMAVYADRDPSDEEVEALFTEWQRRFGRGR